MELLKAISSRRAVRAYTGEQITEEQLDLILKAGCAAPVGKSMYDQMHLTVIQNPEVLSTISESLKMSMHVEFDPLYNAPTLIAVSSEQMPFPGIEAADTGCILENMMLEATDQGLGSVVIWGSGMAINNVPGLKKKILLPEACTGVAGIVVGYAKEEVEAKELELSIRVNRI